MIVLMLGREKELEVYKKNLGGLSAEEGKFALVNDKEVIGVFESYADALKVGYEKSGLKPFLIKQISTVEKFSFFSRELSCPT